MLVREGSVVGSVVIDTASVGSADPVAYWRDAASRVFQPLQVRTADPSAFWARSVAFELCEITLTRTLSEASTITRTARAVAEHDPEALMLVLHLRGRYRVAQDDRTAVCDPGDMAIFDSSRPFRAESQGAIDVMTLALSKRCLPPRGGNGLPLRVPGDRGSAAVLRSLLTGLMSGLVDRSISTSDDAVADSVLSLVRGVVRPREPVALPAATPLTRIKRHIDANLGDPGLTPERIAAAHFISRRQLYTLFEAEGCGVRTWIRERRLERCRRDLRDPALRGETVLTIASRWGFTDASHFSHAFRAAYGTSPRVFREG
jgi:AraC-like DNA-binding protein